MKSIKPLTSPFRPFLLTLSLIAFAAFSYFYLGFCLMLATNAFGDDIGKHPEEYANFVPVGVIGIVIYVIALGWIGWKLVKRIKNRRATEP